VIRLNKEKHSSYLSATSETRVGNIYVKHHEVLTFVLGEG